MNKARLSADLIIAIYPLSRLLSFFVYIFHLLLGLGLTLPLKLRYLSPTQLQRLGICKTSKPKHSKALGAFT